MNIIKRIGGYLTLFIIISSLMGLMGYPSKLMTWFDQWGTTTGWLIKIGLAILGFILWFYADSRSRKG